MAFLISVTPGIFVVPYLAISSPDSHTWCRREAAWLVCFSTPFGFFVVGWMWSIRCKRKMQPLWHFQHLDVGAKPRCCARGIRAHMCVYRSRRIQLQLFQVMFSTLPWEPVVSVLFSYRRRASNDGGFQNTDPKSSSVQNNHTGCKKTNPQCNTTGITLQVIHYNMFWHRCLSSTVSLGNL